MILITKKKMYSQKIHTKYKRILIAEHGKHVRVASGLSVNHKQPNNQDIKRSCQQQQPQQ